MPNPIINWKHHIYRQHTASQSWTICFHVSNLLWCDLRSVTLTKRASTREVFQDRQSLKEKHLDSVLNIQLKIKMKGYSSLAAVWAFTVTLQLVSAHEPETVLPFVGAVRDLTFLSHLLLKTDNQTCIRRSICWCSESFHVCEFPFPFFSPLTEGNFHRLFYSPSVIIKGELMLLIHKWLVWSLGAWDKEGFFPTSHCQSQRHRGVVLTCTRRYSSHYQFMECMNV